MFDWLLSQDAWLFTVLNQLDLGVLGDGFFTWITYLGAVSLIIPVLLVLAATVFRRRWLRFVAVFTVGLSLVGLVTTIIKKTVDRPRPAVVAGSEACHADPDASTPPHPVHLRTHPLCWTSFPSGHTSIAFAWLFGLALFIRKRWATILALTLAALVGYSRIYLGVHYPLDVLFGALLGVSGIAMTVYLAERYFKRDDPEQEVEEGPPANEEPGMNEESAATPATS